MRPVSNIRCICGDVATYGHKGPRALRCVRCKDQTMIKMTRPLCRSKLCAVPASINCSDYCIKCFGNLFPDDERTKRFRTSVATSTVIGYVSSRTSGWLHDAPLFVNTKDIGKSTRRRIDLRKQVGDTTICVEVIEDQIQLYNPANEDDRYKYIMADSPGKYIFIRYNPHRYRQNYNMYDPPARQRMEMLVGEMLRHVTRAETQTNCDALEIHTMFFNC